VIIVFRFSRQLPRGREEAIRIAAGACFPGGGLFTILPKPFIPLHFRLKVVFNFRVAPLPSKKIQNVNSNPDFSV
jgi:hypothetical protein